MSKERFEIFGKIIKDNEEEPTLLDNYLATVRLNEFNEKIKDLQSQLDQANERLSKFKKDDFVYALFTQTEIYKGQIDAFDYYTNSYLVFPNEDVGNEWIKADKVFKTKLEAEKKQKELRGGK